MSKLEKINLEPEIYPVQELTAKEKAVSETARRILTSIATSEAELFNEDELDLSQEKREQLNEKLGELTARTKRVVDGLPEIGEADSHKYSEAA